MRKKFDHIKCPCGVTVGCIRTDDGYKCGDCLLAEIATLKQQLEGLKKSTPCTATLRKIAVGIQPRYEGAAMTMFAWADNLDRALSALTPKE